MKRPARSSSDEQDFLDTLRVGEVLNVQGLDGKKSGLWVVVKIHDDGAVEVERQMRG